MENETVESRITNKAHMVQYITQLLKYCQVFKTKKAIATMRLSLIGVVFAKESLLG